jgi:hypothetical protein
MSRRKRWLVMAFVCMFAVPVMLMLGFVAMFSGGSAVAYACSPPYPMTPGVQLAKGLKLTGEQLGNAQTIIGVGQNLGGTSRDAKVAVWTAYHESSLRNLTYGDGDSLGLFQQRPSQGWGTPEQILNPVFASTSFYEHLFDVPKRNKLSFLDEALAVQHGSRDAYLSPEHNFLKEEPVVDAILKMFGINSSDTSNGPAILEAKFKTLCSSTTDVGVPGKVIMAPGANLPGRLVTPVTLNFLAQVAGIYGKTLVCTTGTNHSYLTVDGRVSDHASGHACDFGMTANGGTDDSPVGDAIANACLRAAGDGPSLAKYEAMSGGLYTREHHGLRIQCIWKTYEGGNHHNHVHIGAKPM